LEPSEAQTIVTSPTTVNYLSSTDRGSSDQNPATDGGRISATAVKATEAPRVGKDCYQKIESFMSEAPQCMAKGYYKEAIGSSLQRLSAITLFRQMQSSYLAQRCI